MEQYSFDIIMFCFICLRICVSKHVVDITLSRPCLAQHNFILLHISELTCKSTLLRSDVFEHIPWNTIVNADVAEDVFEAYFPSQILESRIFKADYSEQVSLSRFL